MNASEFGIYSHENVPLTIWAIVRGVSPRHGPFRWLHRNRVHVLQSIEQHRQRVNVLVQLLFRLLCHLSIRSILERLNQPGNGRHLVAKGVKLGRVAKVGQGNLGRLKKGRCLVEQDVADFIPTCLYLYLPHLTL
ncbi:hypothetical protein TYRP_003815 [Tyrophagus putrescentiae]|nr:hypothetical protein TYRP_003815 [Tyrophagus putrescentiae]